MADSPVFELVSEALEKGAHWDRLEARGTVRLALRTAGLRSDTITAEQMAIVLSKIMPAELATRGISSGEALCTSIAARLGGVSSETPDETPDAIFKRLARR